MPRAIAAGLRRETTRCPCFDGTLILSGNQFINNGGGRGGGTAFGSTSVAFSSDNTYAGNWAIFGDGSFFSGVMLSDGDVYTGNKADEFGGGFLLEGATVVATDLTSVFNNAGSGGGSIAASSGSVMQLVLSLLRQNTAPDGGAIITFNLLGGTGPGPTSSIVNCAFIDNVATRWGGAVHNSGSTLPFIGCLFVRDAAERGGAIYNSASNPPMINGTFTENTASQLGGAVYNTTGSVPDATNCIFRADSPDEIVQNGGVPTVSYSNYQGGVPGAWNGGGNVDVDPLFVDPGNDDWRLAASSPVIDAGRNAALPIEITTDLDENERFVDDPDTMDTGEGAPPMVDMGGYEWQLPCPEDLDGSGAVDFGDILVVLGAWGGCK